jgi:hypothetical protein
MGETVLSTISLSTAEIVAIGCEAERNEPIYIPEKFSTVPDIGEIMT